MNETMLRITSWRFGHADPLVDTTTWYETREEALEAKAFVLTELPDAKPLFVNQPKKLPAGIQIEHFASVHYHHRFVLISLCG